MFTEPIKHIEALKAAMDETLALEAAGKLTDAREAWHKGHAHMLRVKETYNKTLSGLKAKRKEAPVAEVEEKA